MRPIAWPLIRLIPVPRRFVKVFQTSMATRLSQFRCVYGVHYRVSRVGKGEIIDELGAYARFCFLHISN